MVVYVTKHSSAATSNSDIVKDLRSSIGMGSHTVVLQASITARCLTGLPPLLRDICACASSLVFHLLTVRLRRFDGLVMLRG